MTGCSPDTSRWPSPGSVQVKTPNPSLNEETFAPLDAKFVRFNIHDASLHPTLGLIEPCIDEFEVFSDEPSPRNVALASNGGKVTASGSRTSEIHRLEHINDGEFGNARSWMSDEPGRGTVTVEIAEPTRINRITWSRDRQAVFSDRLATAYTIEAGPSLDALTTIVDASPSRPAVNAQVNSDRFAPVATRRVRFTINATNRLEPCIDELEIFDASGRNVALASAGAAVRSSGDTAVANRHDLSFINDGLYGNSHSWMSNQPGKGWVEIDLGSEQTIERVSWGRDRQAEYEDRLAIDYRIEVVAPDGAWRVVADSSDRHRFTAEKRKPAAPSYSTAGLSGDDVRKVRAIEAERKALEAQIAAASRAGSRVRRRLPQARHDPPAQSRRPRTAQGGGRPGPAQRPRRIQALRRDRRARTPPRTGRLDRVARESADRAGDGQPHLAGAFRHGPGRDGKRFRPNGDQAVAPRAARLAGCRVHPLRLVDQATASPDRSLIHLPPIHPTPARGVRQGRRRRLLWRFPSRRLDAETIRDSMLAVSGRLDPKMGGSGFDLFDKRGGLTGFKPVESFQGEGLRRMIYAHKVRRERDAVFGAFDCPDAGQSTARRRESTTPIQALNLFNSRFTLEQADAFAARVTQDAGGDVDRQVHRAFELALTRRPERGGSRRRPDRRLQVRLGHALSRVVQLQ